MNKDALKAGLGTPPVKPAIQRGRGLTLSTAEPQPEPADQAAGAPETAADLVRGRHLKTIQDDPRIRQGMEIRKSVLKALKQATIKEETKLYLLVEQALTEYLERNHPELLP